MKILKNSNSILTSVLVRCSFLFSERTFLKLLYKRCLGKVLDLDNPQSYNEKLQWLKLYNRKPLYTKLVDKYEVKKWVAEKIGDTHVIKTIGVWERFEDINFDKLPARFVLKSTNGGGNTGVIICKDKATFNVNSARRCLNRSMHTWVDMGEWPYKGVKPRIIAEEYMEDEKTHELRDYKFFCFDGKVKALFIATDRGIKGDEPKFDFYDADFNHLPFKQGHPHQKRYKIEKPKTFDEMKRIAEVLSEGEPHMRVDLYEINGEVYFGEITFFHFGGLTPFEPEEWDYRFGEWLNLPHKVV